MCYTTITATILLTSDNKICNVENNTLKTSHTPEELAMLQLFHAAALATHRLSHFPTCAVILPADALTLVLATLSHLVSDLRFLEL